MFLLFNNIRGFKPQMCLETNFQCESLFLGCLGQSGLQKKIHTAICMPLFRPVSMFSWGKSNFIFVKYPTVCTDLWNFKIQCKYIEPLIKSLLATIL